MNLLGNGLSAADHHDEALSAKEALLSTERRLGESEDNILVMQGNLANSYAKLGRLDEALSLRKDVYSRTLKLYGEEHKDSIVDAFNYARDLLELRRFKEVKPLLRKTIPVALRILGKDNEVTLALQWNYGEVLYEDPAATLDDLREAVETLEETDRTARRVLGGTHPTTGGVARHLRSARAALAARETPQPAEELEEIDQS